MFCCLPFTKITNECIADIHVCVTHFGWIFLACSDALIPVLS